MKNNYILTNKDTMIIRNDMGFSEGKSLIEYIEVDWVSSYLDMISMLGKDTNLVQSNLMFTVDQVEQEVTALSFNDNMLFIVHQLVDTVEILRDISMMMNETVNSKRANSKLTIHNRTVLEEMAVLNNKLSNMQREISKKNVALSKITLTDTLTGAWNRRAFFEDLRQIKEDVMVGMIDIDHFKHINDTLGHLVGDELLVFVVEQSIEQLKGITTKGFYRIGGDEFSVIIPMDKKDEAISKINNVSDLINSKYGKVSLSYGFSVIPIGFTRNELDSLISVADTNMYENKRIKKSTK